MYKQFLLEKNYKFNIRGDYYFNNNLFLVSDNELVNIEINGRTYSLSASWLGLICHYEVNLPIDELYKINFVKASSRVLKIRCGFLMQIKNPIMINREFRLIPGFPNFMINKHGVVKSIKYNRTLTLSKNAYGYPCVNIYDPDKTKWRQVNLHLLIARAFIFNLNPEINWCINHKDGNKENFKLSNLEWSSSQKNNSHAVIKGLRTDNKLCLVRDIKYNKINEFESLSKAFSFIGIKSIKPFMKNIQGKLIPRLFKDRYEIKLKSDSSDWYYSELNKKESSFKVHGPFQVKDIKTNIVYEIDTIKELNEKTKVSVSKIRNALVSIENLVYNGYIFRTKRNDEWSNDYSLVRNNPKRSFVIRNIFDNTEKYFSSLRQLTSFLKIDKKTLKNKLQNNKQCDNWNIIEITPYSPI
jgi:hypothetical protein